MTHDHSERWKHDGVRVIPGHQLDPNVPSTPGMDRKAAINFARAGAKKLWAGTVTIKPAADYDLLLFSRFNHDKPEGLALANGGKTVVVSNDDDEGIITGQDINGQPGFRSLAPDGRLINVVQVDIADGRVQRVHSILNPDKLSHVSFR